MTEESAQERRSSLQNERDRAFVQENLKDFEPMTSKAWKFLEARFGPEISKPRLVSLGCILALHLNIPLVREYKRRKGMMIKWFDDNFDCIQPFIEKCVEVTFI
jgi:hypothetical protein